MQEFWKIRSTTYAQATDLETKVRSFFATVCNERVKPAGKILELGSGNGAVLRLIEKSRKNFDITGVDSSPEMNAVAKSRLPGNIKIISEDLMGFLERNVAIHDASAKYDAILICNTLHNLKSRDEMERALVLSSQLLTTGGILIVDIRNSFNIFVAHGYRQNRARGLQFFTVTPLWLKRATKKSALTASIIQPIYYSTLEEAGKEKRNLLHRSLYRLYLLLTRVWFFSPYYAVVLTKNPNTFCEKNTTCFTKK